MSFITRKRIVRTLLIIAVLLLGYALYYGWQVVAIGTAYKAKVLCSGIFISKRNPENILKEDLGGILSIIDSKIDCEGSSVTTSFPGIPSQQAIFRDGLGCTLLAIASEMEVRGQTSDVDFKPLTPSDRENDIAGFKGFGGQLPTKVSTGKLAELIGKAVSDEIPGE